ncbi:uncharacterized protein LOC123313617 isoform X2 [Coccinella septempunctata]|nr:uncharacterized protein LOC123313617 isoform X2 [Coccinella septempunctata]
MLLTESFETVIGKDFKENSGWNRLQTKLRCCGLNGVKDFGQAGSYPTFCCDGRKEFNITCFDNGCRQPLADYARGIMLDGVLMSFLSCLLQAFGVFIFFSFFQTLKRDRDIKSARRLAIMKELAEHSEHATPLTQSPLPSTTPMYTPQRNETPKSSKRRSSKAAAPLTPPVQVNV